MQNNPLGASSLIGFGQENSNALKLTLPQPPAGGSVLCLTEHEVDVAQDLGGFIQLAVSWRRGDERGPSVSTLEKIDYLFDVAATLFGAGARPRLVAEALLHPVVAGDDRVASSEDRRQQLVGYLGGRFRERPFLAAENKLSSVPAGSISYDIPTSFTRDKTNWPVVKHEILTPILDKLRAAPEFSPVYSDDQLSFIREGFRMALEQLSSSNIAGPGAWDTLFHRMDIGLLLLSTKRSPEVVVAGMLHDLRPSSSADAWPKLRQLIELHFGPRVAELVELIGPDPTALPMCKAREASVFGEPLLLGRIKDCSAELRQDLETLIATKSVSFLGRNLMETLPLVRAFSMPMRGVPDVLVTGLNDWGELRWTEKIAISASYCDCIYTDKRFRPIFDRTIRTWAKGPKFLPGTIGLMTARKAFEELFPREHESVRSRLDSMHLVHQVMKATLETGNQARATAGLLSSYATHTGNVDRLKEVQKRMENFEEGLFADQSRTPQFRWEIKPVEHTALERELIVQAVDFIADFLGRNNLRDMVRNPVDQMKHSCEVGFLLMRSGVKADIIIAGLLHDVYELTPLEELPKIRQQVVETFAHLGERVDALIDIVTEPPKDPLVPRENYIIRKSKIIGNLEALYQIDPSLARDAATVVCVAKMSTMKDGYHFASDFAKVQPWTKGSWSENVRAMCGLHDMFERFGIFPQLLGAYREELAGWIEVTRHMLPSLLDDSVLNSGFNEEVRKNGLNENVRTLLKTVESFHRSLVAAEGNDIRLLVSQAAAVTNNIPQYAVPVDAQNATNVEVATFINEVGRLVFLPQGIYLFNRIVEGWCEIVSGVVADTKRCSYSYLGKEFDVYDVRFEHGLNNLTDVSATIDGQILIDQALSALHGRRVIERVNYNARQGDGITNILAEAIIKHRISPERFEQVQGYDRHLFQQLACAEDSRYLELLAGPNNFRFNDTRYSNDLLKGDDSISWMFTFGTQIAHILVRQYSAVLGGLDKQLQHYLTAGDLVSAKVCFLTAYLNLQDAVSQTSSSLISSIRAAPAELFLRKMRETLTPEFLEIGMFSSDEWEGDIKKVARAVHQIYSAEFYNQNERVGNIVFIDTAQGRPTHPVVLAEIKGAGVQ